VLTENQRPNANDNSEESGIVIFASMLLYYICLSIACVAIVVLSYVAGMLWWFIATICTIAALYLHWRGIRFSLSEFEMDLEAGRIRLPRLRYLYLTSINSLYEYWRIPVTTAWGLRTWHYLLYNCFACTYGHKHRARRAPSLGASCAVFFFYTNLLLCRV